MFLGYNTNGFAHHRLLDAIRVLADLGYRGIAITIDHHAFDPRAEGTPRQLAAVRDVLAERGLRSVIETGARYLLDPANKHEPTLISPGREGRARRVGFYRHAIDCAVELGSDCVSIWSGVASDAAPHEELTRRLTDGLSETLDYAANRGVKIAFEPEPGMFIDTAAAFRRLLEQIDHPNLGLTLDIGHLQCMGEPIGESITAWADRLVNVHIEDMRRGDHTHLFFGEGEIDFHAVFAALAESAYQDGVYVELSRHSHLASNIARRAQEFLNPLLESSRS